MLSGKYLFKYWFPIASSPGLLPPTHIKSSQKIKRETPWYAQTHEQRHNIWTWAKRPQDPAFHYIDHTVLAVAIAADFHIDTKPTIASRPHLRLDYPIVKLLIC